MLKIILNIVILIWLLYCLIKSFNGLKQKYSTKELQIISYGACFGMMGYGAVRLVSTLLVQFTEFFIGG